MIAGRFSRDLFVFPSLDHLVLETPPAALDTMGEDTLSGLMFEDDFVEISETPEVLQKQIRESTKVR